MRFIRNWRVYVVVFFSYLVLDWGVGVARFYWLPLKKLFFAINLPSSLLFLHIEAQSNTWWHSRFGSLVGDELGSSLAFLVMVLAQSLLIGTILLLFKRFRR